MKKLFAMIICFALIISAAALCFAEGDEENEEGAPSYYDYENYLYYNNTYNDGRYSKGSGYTIESIMVYVSEEFASEHEGVTAEDFPDIADKIQIILHGEYSPEYGYEVFFDYHDDGLQRDFPVYSEADIDEYIARLEYIRSLDFVTSADPSSSIIAYVPEYTYPGYPEMEPAVTEPAEATEPETTATPVTEDVTAETEPANAVRDTGDVSPTMGYGEDAPSSDAPFMIAAVLLFVTAASVFVWAKKKHDR